MKSIEGFLASDVQILIFKQLDFEDLLNVALVCESFYRNSSSDSIWERFGDPNWLNNHFYTNTTTWKQRYLKWLKHQSNLYLEGFHRTESYDANNRPVTRGIASLQRVATKLPFTYDPNIKHYAVVDKEYDLLLKLLLIGDAGVGKTSFFTRYMDDQFYTSYMSSMGIDFKIKTVTIDNINVKLQIWDTAGQERFRTIQSSYYRGCMGVFAMYAMDDESSFESLVQKWLPEIEQRTEGGLGIVIVGCKSDLMSEVPSAMGESLADSKGLDSVETSAKTGENVEKAVSLMLKQIIRKAKYEHFGIKDTSGAPRFVPSIELVMKKLEGKIKKQEPTTTTTSQPDETPKKSSMCIIQ